MSNRLIIAICCIVIFALPWNTAFSSESSITARRSDSPAKLARKIDPIVEAARSELKLPGVSIAIMRGHKLIFAKGYGLADREAGVVPSAGTIYPIASLSKQFTAAAIMKLVEERQVRLDEAVATYVPGYHVTQTPVLRIRHLLYQTSGIPEWTDLPEMQGLDTSDPGKFTFPKLIDIIGRQTQLYPPGEWWSYSNSNYSLLAAVIERVSGKTYEQYLSETFFVPLGLRSTGSCQPDLGLPVGAKAVGYESAADSFKLRPLSANLARIFKGPGGLCSNAADLVSWMRALVDGRVVSAASYRQMTTTAPVRAGFTPPYGFGLSVRPLIGQPAVWHMGVTSGFVSVLVYFPKQDLIIAALTNSRHALLQEVVKRVGRRLMNLPAPTLRDLPISAEEASRSAGNYDDAMFKFRVYADSGKLYVDVPDLGPPVRLLYQGKHEFAEAGPWARRFWFEPAAGRAERVVWEWGEIRAYGHRAQ